jgi:hypothetical protein
MPQGGCRLEQIVGLRGVSRTILAAVARSAGVVLALAALAATAHAQASWLDSPPPPWNVPGAPVPAAPPGGTPVDPQCQAQERAPVGSEEMAVVARGWRLTSAWPIQRAGVVAVLRATAAYDGMCRPTDYNAFVFEGGQFAGTLSPVQMFARTDGALVEIPVVGADGRITATFVRYGPTDPLCCPSLPNTTVTYRMQGTAGSRVVVREQASPPVSGPAQLPRTGGPPVPPIGWAAGLTLLAGGLLRRVSR